MEDLDGTHFVAVQEILLVLVHDEQHKLGKQRCCSAEGQGFDCAKAHPAMGNYHHHQNPSAFNLDLVVSSNVCDLYPSDGLYVINPSEHAPLLGFVLLWFSNLWCLCIY